MFIAPSFLIGPREMASAIALVIFESGRIFSDCLVLVTPYG